MKTIANELKRLISANNSTEEAFTKKVNMKFDKVVASLETMIQQPDKPRNYELLYEIKETLPGFSFDTLVALVKKAEKTIATRKSFAKSKGISALTEEVEIENMKIIAKRIRAIRKSQDLSQKECADILGMEHVSNYSRIENGGMHLNAVRLMQLSVFFNVSPMTILDPEGPDPLALEMLVKQKDEIIESQKREISLLEENISLFQKVKDLQGKSK